MFGSWSIDFKVYIYKYNISFSNKIGNGQNMNTYIFHLRINFFAAKHCWKKMFTVS